MKAKTKVVLAMTLLFLVSTIANVTSVIAVKNGEVVKIHFSAEGPGYWDPTATVLITANIEHTYTSSWNDKANFKKIGWDPIKNEEFMECHGRLQGGNAWFFEWWQDPNTDLWWQYVWVIQGIGVVKTPTAIYREAVITILFVQGGNWAWAAYEDLETGDSGPNNPMGRLGCLTFPITWEEIGADQFDFVKQEQETVLDVWLNEGNRITDEYYANIAETQYIVVGMLQLDEEKKDKVFNLPWDWKMWLDGWEIPLNRFWWFDKDGELTGERQKVLVFYYIFEPWTLSWGERFIDHEVSWYNGVGAHTWQETIGWQWNFTVTFWW
ncbi:MAG: hypothetical protein ACW98X_21190 [Promethearchaeota archaeon]